MFFSKKFTNFNNISHCFFSKKGGVSQGVYNSLNCGLGSNDKRNNILKIGIQHTHNRCTH